MDKQHALDVLNSKQLHNVVKLFEKYAQVPGAANIYVKDLEGAANRLHQRGARGGL
ncbi:hypothetical protein NHP22001_11430 [Helicobacter sp. NHP22-001]|nr:hypothetical protein NHP22001_11430 [Helicobacter sp. NHP22-001]